MSTVACPHCGLQNFDVSAYCARCERPLKPAGVSPSRVVPAAAAAPRLPTVPPPPPPEAMDEVVTVVMRRPPMFPTPKASQRSVAPQSDTAAPKLAAPPPRSDVEQTEVRRVPSLPRLERPPPAAARRVDVGPALAERATLAAPPPPAPHSPATTTPAQPAAAGRVRIIAAHLTDLIVVCGIGAFVASLEIAFAMPRWRPHAGIPLDVLAQWLVAHGDAVKHGALTALVLGTLYHAGCTVRGGKTLGRWLAGTVLVRKSGAPMRWFVVAPRTLLAWLSLGLFGAGFFWVIVDRSGRAWHDILCGTVVLRTRDT